MACHLIEIISDATHHRQQVIKTLLHFWRQHRLRSQMCQGATFQVRGDSLTEMRCAGTQVLVFMGSECDAHTAYAETLLLLAKAFHISVSIDLGHIGAGNGAHVTAIGGIGGFTRGD